MKTDESSPEKKPGFSDQLKAAPKWVKISVVVGLAVAAVVGGIMDEVASRAEGAEIQAANESAASGQDAVTIGTTGKDDSAHKLRAGDCFRSKQARDGHGFDEVEFVDCNGSWDFVVLNSFALADGGEFPGDEVFHQEASRRCDRNYSDIISPTEAGWSKGSRVVDCLLSHDAFVAPAVGECFLLDEAGGLLDVSCDAPHDFEAIHVTSYTGGGSYPGDAEIFRFADEACLGALDEQTDTEGSKLSLVRFTPSAATWSALGDRTVSCFLLETDEPGQLVLTPVSAMAVAS